VRQGQRSEEDDEEEAGCETPHGAAAAAGCMRRRRDVSVPGSGRYRLTKRRRSGVLIVL
jgi:hypothetical protein